MDTGKFTQTSFLIKLLEMILGAVCVGLIAQEACAITLPKTEVVHATYFGFFMITSIIVISYVLDSPIKGSLMLVISVCGGVLYVTSGALNIELYDKGYKRDKLLGAGVVGIINGAVFLVDGFLAWRLK